MTVYIDFNFKCHTENPDGMYRSFEVEFFDGKCDAFIEGYLYIPSGEVRTRSDGVVFHGEMIAPWKPYNELAAAQSQYERDQDELVAAYQEGVNSV